MLKAGLARLWLLFCASEVYLDPLGGVYYVHSQSAPDATSPCRPADVDEEWLRVGAAWSAACGLQHPDSTA